MGDTPVAVASKHVRENPPAPRDINPSVPPDLEAIVLKCLAKDPQYRYATGDDLRVDLLRFREGRAVAAVAPPPLGSMGTTSAIPFVTGTQMLPPSERPHEEPERSRTGLYAGLLVVLLVALAVVVAFLGQSLGWWHLGSSDTVAVPGVVGQNVIVAERAMDSAGLKTTLKVDPFVGKPNTEVVATEPGKGVSVKKGSLVTLLTGDMGPLVTVQPLVNQSVTVATSTVSGQGLKPVVKFLATCTQQNIVCKQSPQAGTKIKPGATVTLYTAPSVTTTTTTSTTIPTGQVPNVTGDTNNIACNAIVNARFVCGTVTMTTSNFPLNTVVSTSPPAGSTQPVGTTVNLVESSGTGLAPNLMGLSQDAAVQALTNDGLTAVVTCVVPTGGQMGDQVVSQSPQAGQPAPAGSSVAITVTGNPTCPNT